MKKGGANPAKRLGLREFHVHFGMFDFAMVCVVGRVSSDAIERYVAWKFNDGEPVLYPEGHKRYEPRGRYYFRYGYVPVLWIPGAPRTPREYGTLAHEVLHVVRRLMEWAAIPMSEDSEEVWCHAVGFAVTAILEKLR